jgi:ADP-heptose:LPS heptosyltransferase
MKLFKRSFPEVDFYKRIRPIDEDLYDAHIPMGSLGKLYRRDLASFAQVQHPYLRADPALVNDFRSRFAPDKPIIGISWSTGNPDNGRYRNIDLASLVRIFVGKNINLVNLQYKFDQAEVSAVQELTDISLRSFPDIDNFADIDRLAALISVCDLVVSIGNATAHLSAAIGRPTWVLTPVSGSWRWLLEGESTPWYPSVRVFRQRHPGEWTPVLDQIADELNQFLSASEF